MVMGIPVVEPVLGPPVVTSVGAFVVVGAAVVSAAVGFQWSDLQLDS